MLNVHIVGGTTDISEHLDGATIRPAVVEELIRALRESGYPGYGEDGPNSEHRVKERLEKLYKRPYQKEKFIPKKIEESTRKAWTEQRGQASLIQDKKCNSVGACCRCQSIRSESETIGNCGSKKLEKFE